MNKYLTMLLSALVLGFSLPSQASEAVSYSFAVDPSSMVSYQVDSRPSVTQSREYSLDVSGKALQQGISLTTHAPGALVRISAADGRSAVEPQMLTISQKNGKSFAKGSGFKLLLDSQAMQAQGVGFQPGTTGFQIAKELGKGEFRLRSEQPLAPNTKFRINVFDKQSDAALYLKSHRNAYLKNDTLQVTAQLFNQGRAINIRSIKGRLLSPTGQAYPVIFKKAVDGFQVKMPMKLAADNIPGALWELHTEIKAHLDGVLVQRNGRVPFAYDELTATLGDRVQLVGGNRNLKAMIPVTVEKDSRFEVRAVLYGTDASGNMQPIMMTHTADNLGRGANQIMMEFDSAILANSGFGAPYELRHIELRDQKQMAILK